jgi:exoribonuclease-2
MHIQNTTQSDQRHTRSDLVRLANTAMVEHGLEPEFPESVTEELSAITVSAKEADPSIQDLTSLLWCSIDNNDSLDLDQLTVAEFDAAGGIKMRVAVADVDALVKRDSLLDLHARFNTTSIYTSGRIFPMLPPLLSTNLTSLNQGVDRLALVTEMSFKADGTLSGSTVYRAIVHNKAKLAYDQVSAWLEDPALLPESMATVPGLEDQLRAQDKLAQQLRTRRHLAGALTFETFQPRAIFENEKIVTIVQQVQNRARQLIEEMMIMTNSCNALFLTQHGVVSLRRMVRSPERWQRIVEFAKTFGASLPNAPDSAALAAFLIERHKADPLRFPDLSMVIIKLMGRGEYVAGSPDGDRLGHFGLAVQNYTHSTAPNRRYPDLITSRQIKAALVGLPSPYSDADIVSIALHCTEQAAAAQKVERQLRKSEAVLLLESRIGQSFDAIVTGSADTGVWVRIIAPPVEGKLDKGADSLKVGDTLRVTLVSTNFERGFIDFRVADELNQ